VEVLSVHSKRKYALVEENPDQQTSQPEKIFRISFRFSCIEASN